VNQTDAFRAILGVMVLASAALTYWVSPWWLLMTVFIGLNLFPAGIVAWVMGHNDLCEMDAGRMDPSGRGLTSAGVTCGIISVVIAVIGSLIGMVVLAAATSGAFH